MFRFISRVWRLVQYNSDIVQSVKPRVSNCANMRELNDPEQQILRVMHNSIKGTGEDLDRMHFNTALSRIMELVNALVPYAGEEAGNAKADPEFLAESLRTLVLLLAPFAPHTCEELWQDGMGCKGSVFNHQWPLYDQDILKEDFVTIVIQVNGKLRSHLDLSRDASEEEMCKAAMADDKVLKYIEGKTVRKIIAVPNKLINIVVG